MICNITILNKSEMYSGSILISFSFHDFLFIWKRVQEMESESCAQQREQESLLAVICKSLKEEHQAEQKKLQRQMAQVQENHRKQSFAVTQRNMVL